MPSMGTVAFTLDFSADMNDDKNVTFEVTSTLLDMALHPVQQNIRKVRVTYWKDESIMMLPAVTPFLPSRLMDGLALARLPPAAVLIIRFR